MNATIVLRENELKFIVAEAFGVKPDDVRVRVESVLVGYGPSEHMEAKLDCVEIKVPLPGIPKITIE